MLCYLILVPKGNIIYEPDEMEDSGPGERRGLQPRQAPGLIFRVTGKYAGIKNNIFSCPKYIGYIKKLFEMMTSKGAQL